MCKVPTLLVTLFTHLVAEILAVNSPQMTFFTPPSHETTIHLESKYGYSATLKLTRQKLLTHMKNYENSESSSGVNNETNGRKVSEFLILGPDYLFHGVSAVIQEMNLRASREKDECRDFVQFAANAVELNKSSKICGRISRDENWNEKNITDPRLQRSYFNSDGTIHLYFFSDSLDNNELIDSDGHRSAQDEDIGIEIVFTSYTVCPNPANSWKKLKSCSNSNNENMSCIYSTLFCDSKIDCGFPGEFGLDEEGCYIPYIFVSTCILGCLFITAALIYVFLKWVTKVPKEYQSSMTT